MERNSLLFFLTSSRYFNFKFSKAHDSNSSQNRSKFKKPWLPVLYLPSSCFFPIHDSWLCVTDQLILWTMSSSNSFSAKKWMFHSVFPDRFCFKFLQSQQLVRYLFYVLSAIVFQLCVKVCLNSSRCKSSMLIVHNFLKLIMFLVWFCNQDAL